MRLLVAMVAFGCLCAHFGHAADRYWVGNGNFNDSTWSLTSGGAPGASVPGSADKAIFDGGGTGPCTIAATRTIGGMDIRAGYSGTVTQAPGVNFTVGTSNYLQAAGTFVGGNGSLTMTGVFTLSAGSFTSTSGTLQLAKGFTHVAGGTFAHNNGTVKFTGASATIDVAGGETFFDLELAKNGGATLTIAAGDTLTVLGRLSLTDGLVSQSIIPAAGSILLHGDLVQASTFDGGTANLVLTGTDNQTLTGTATGTLGQLPNLIFNKSGGTAVLAGTLRTARKWTYLSGGLDAGASWVVFASSLTIAGSHTLANVHFDSNSTSSKTVTFSSGTTLTVTGTAVLDNSSTGNIVLNGGTLAAQGDIVVGEENFTGTTLLLINGSTDQTMSGQATALSGGVPVVRIDKPSGKLTINGTVRTLKNWTRSAGLLEADAAHLVLAATLTVQGSQSFGSLTLNTNTTANRTVTLSSGTTLTVTGTLTLDNASTGNILLNGGTLAAQGDIVVDDRSYAGTTTLLLNGAGNQALVGAATPLSGGLPALKVDKPSGWLNLEGTLRIVKNITYVIKPEGGINPGSSTFVFSASLTINGYWPLANVVFDTNSTAAKTFTFSSAGMWVDGDLRADNSSTGTMNFTNAWFGVFGDVRTDTTVNGTAELALYGWDDQALDIAKWPAGGISVTKPGGTARLERDLTLNGSNKHLSILEGAFDLAGHNLTVPGNIIVSYGKLVLEGSETIVRNGLQLDPGSTVAYLSAGTHASLILGGQYHHLHFDGGGTWTHPQLTVQGDLFVFEGTLNSNGQLAEVGGDWGNFGTYVAAGNEVRLTGADQRILGSTSFHQLTKVAAAPSTLTFEHGKTQVITDSLTLAGSEVNRLYLRSDQPGSLWRIDPQGERNLPFVSVQDSENLNTVAIEPSDDSRDLGNNLGWVFPLAVPTPIAPFEASTPVNPTFLWTNEGAPGYDVEVEDLTAGGSVVEHADFDFLEWPNPLVPGHAYRWRVRLAYDDDTASGWSDYLEFGVVGQITVLTPPGSPTSPAWFELETEATVSSIAYPGSSPNNAISYQVSGQRRWTVRPQGFQPPGIPLSPTEPTGVLVSTDQGSVLATLTWEPTDLTGLSAPNDHLTVRQGDAVLATATGSGAALEIKVLYGGNVQTYTGVPGERFPITFNSYGTYTLEARIDGNLVGSMDFVSVWLVDLGQSNDLACGVNQTRQNIQLVEPPEAVPEITFYSGNPAKFSVNQTPRPPDPEPGEFSGAGFNLTIEGLDRGSKTPMPVRLNGPDGPMLQLLEVHTFELINEAAWKPLEPDENGEASANVTMRPWAPGVYVRFSMPGDHDNYFESGTHEFLIESEFFDLQTDPNTGEQIGVFALGFFIDPNPINDEACFFTDCAQETLVGTVTDDPEFEFGFDWAMRLPLICPRIDDGQSIPCDIAITNVPVYQVNGSAVADATKAMPGDQVGFAVNYQLTNGLRRFRGEPDQVVINQGPLYFWLPDAAAQATGPNTNQTFDLVYLISASGGSTTTITLSPKPTQDLPWNPDEVGFRLLDIKSNRRQRFSGWQVEGLSSKYRGVDVHGAPVPEASPTGEGESDRLPNRAYIDMFNLRPTYSVTDGAVPMEGGEMVLEFRRTCTIERTRSHPTGGAILDGRFVYPFEKLLGSGWHTCLGSRVTVNPSGLVTATAIDEVGNMMQYAAASYGGEWIPLVADSFSSESVRNRLKWDGVDLVIERTFGTRIRYAPRGAHSSLDFEQSEFLFLVDSVTDRHGNVMKYEYFTEAEAETLLGYVNPGLRLALKAEMTYLVKRIYELDHPSRSISFTYHWMPHDLSGNPTGADLNSNDKGWRLTEVRDALTPAHPERVTLYSYYDQRGGADPNPGVPEPQQFFLLKSVQQPPVANPQGPTPPTVRPTVNFTYKVFDLDEQRLVDINPTVTGWTGYRARYTCPHLITDSRGHQTRFEYVAENFPFSLGYSGLVMNGVPQDINYAVFEPRMRLSSVQTADGTATFNPPNDPAWPRTATLVKTHVVDTRGTMTSYEFNSELRSILENQASFTLNETPGAGQALARFHVQLNLARQMTRTTHVNTALPANERLAHPVSAVFEWAGDTNLNLTKVTDCSGNAIHWFYQSSDPDDLFDRPIRAADPQDDFSNPRFYQVQNLPARRYVEAIGAITDYRYETKFSKLTVQIDAEDKAVRHTIDPNNGNRTAVTEGLRALRNPDNTVTLAPTSITRTSQFEYSTSTPDRGFLKKSIDPDGRITNFSKTFTPSNLNAFVTLESHVRGLPNGPDLDIRSKTVADVMGNTRTSVPPNGYGRANETDYATTFEFDNLDREIRRTLPKVEDPAAPAQQIAPVIETAYDLNGNVITATDPHGKVSHTYYDAMNRVRFSRRCMTPDLDRHRDTSDLPVLAAIPAADILAETRYNAAGLPSHSIEPNGMATAQADDFTTELFYDELLRLTLKRLPITSPASIPDLTADPSRFEERYKYGYFDSEQKLRGNPGSGAFTTLSGWNPTRVINRRGFATDTTYDGIYRAIQTVRRLDAGPTLHTDGARPGEPSVSTIYNRVHNPVMTVTLNEDFAGNSAPQVSRAFYDDLHRVTVTAFDFDGDNAGPDPATTFVNDALAFAGDPEDFVARTVYDKAGNVLKAVDAENRAAESVYDGAGRVVQTLGESVPFYDPVPYNTGATVRPTAKFTYDKNGNRILGEDPNKTRVKTVFDRLNRPIQVIVNVDGNSTYAGNSSADSTNVRGTYTRQPENGAADTISDMFYDLSGNVLKTIDPRGLVTQSQYDDAYRPVAVTGEQVADAENSNALTSPVTQTAYDPNGKPVLLTDPRGVQTKTVYDGLNRARKVTAALGTPVSVTTESQYDANNNVTALILHNGFDTDGDGVVDLIDPQQTSYVFNALDRQVSQTLPSADDGWTRATLTTYYRNGNIRTVTDPKGQVTETEHDRANRTTVTRFKRTDQSTEETRTFAYNKVGKPTTVTDLNGSSTFVYDALYRVTAETRQTTGQADYTVASSYDANSNRTRCIYPQTARTLTSRFDRVNRLTRVTDSDGNKQTDYVYDANGNRKSCALPNGVTDTFTYDKLNRVLTHQANSGAIYNLSYGYDLVGNRRVIDETVQGQAARNLVYTYDDQYRLTSESWSGNSYTYSYDLAGNRLSKSEVSPTSNTTTSYHYNRLNQLLLWTHPSGLPGAKGSSSFFSREYSYDLNGNRIHEEWHELAFRHVTFSYDTLDRLVSVNDGSPQFDASYDYRTRRLTKAVYGTTTYFRYDGGDCFQEVTGGTTPAIQVEFVRGSGMGGGIGSILYSDRNLVSGPEEFFTYNAVGHTVALTNSSGVVTSTNLYEAFGNIVSSTGSSQNNRLANTKERDFNIGLDNHGFRYFDPEIGRYISADPMGLKAGFNLYSYVRNNPINHIDPLGLEDDLDIQIARAMEEAISDKDLERQERIHNFRQGLKFKEGRHFRRVHLANLGIGKRSTNDVNVGWKVAQAAVDTNRGFVDAATRGITKDVRSDVLGDRGNVEYKLAYSGGMVLEAGAEVLLLKNGGAAARMGVMAMNMAGGAWQVGRGIDDVMAGESSGVRKVVYGAGVMLLTGVAAASAENGSQEPERLYRTVEKGSRHDLEAQQLGTMTPRGGNATPYKHITEYRTDSNYTSWTESDRFANTYGELNYGEGKYSIYYVENPENTRHYARDLLPEKDPLLKEREVLLEGVVNGVKELNR